jgi:hypothetical protein
MLDASPAIQPQPFARRFQCSIMERLHSSATLLEGMGRLSMQQQPSTPTRPMVEPCLTKYVALITVSGIFLHLPSVSQDHVFCTVELPGKSSLR